MGLPARRPNASWGTALKVSRGNRVRATQSKATMAVATWERLATGLFSSALELKRSLPELASMAI